MTADVAYVHKTIYTYTHIYWHWTAGIKGAESLCKGSLLGELKPAGTPEEAS